MKIFQKSLFLIIIALFVVGLCIGVLNSFAPSSEEEVFFKEKISALQFIKETETDISNVFDLKNEAYEAVCIFVDADSYPNSSKDMAASHFKDKRLSLPKNNDTDGDGDALSTPWRTVTTEQGGTVAIQTDGIFTYRAAQGFTGQDSFTYEARDGLGGADAATVNITVNAAPNTAPVARDDNIGAGFHGGVSGNVLAHNGNGPDSDINQDILTVTAGTVQTVNGGLAVLQGNGDFVYAPADGFSGTDSFQYEVSDGRGGSDMATVTVSNIAINRVPTANDDSYATQEDTALQGNVLSNDTDPDFDTLSVQPQTIATAQGGTVAMQQDGQFTYTPAADFHGTDSFGYTMTDGFGGSGMATATIAVGSISDAPEARDDAFQGSQNAAVTGNVLADNDLGADRDGDGDALTVQPAILQTAAGGTVALLANGNFTYTPTADFHGPDSFIYTLRDSTGRTDLGSVSLSIAPSNTAPVAVDDAVDAAEQATVSGNLLANDSDPDGDAFTAWAQAFVTEAGNAVSINPDGSFTMTARTGFTGSDSFQYTIEDSYGATAIATANITGLFGEVPKPTINLQSISLDTAVREIVTGHEYIPPPPDFPALVERQAVDTGMINGVINANLTLNESHEVKVKFVTEGAGYKNSLGFYTVDADGKLGNAQMLAENLSGTGSGVFGGGGFDAGDLVASLGVLAAGTQIGFFIVADGYNANKSYGAFNFEGGHLEFRDTKNGNGIADTSDKGRFVDLVLVNDATGKVKQVAGNIYHTASLALNEDGLTHAISGFSTDGNLLLGFEDLYGYGDRDFNDVVIEVEIGPHVDHALDPVAVLSAIDIANPEGGMFAEATVAFSAGKQDGDRLTFNLSLLEAAGLSATVNADGSVVFSDVANDTAYESLLQSIKFESNAGDPAAGIRSFSVTVKSDLGLSVTAGVSIDVHDDTHLPVTPDFAIEPEPISLAEAALAHSGAFMQVNGKEKLTLDFDNFENLHGATMQDGRGNDKLTLRAADIFDANQAFGIRGDRGDVLQLKGMQAMLQDTQQHDGGTFNIYATSKGVTLVIDAEVTVKGDVA